MSNYNTDDNSNNDIHNKSIPTLSLFTGAGGLDIGFHKAGFNIIGCVEIEQAYCNSLEENRKQGRYFSNNTKIHCMDIGDFDPKEYLDAGIECIIGGPPCQPFSAAGRRSGGVMGTLDKRGKLFEAYCRILSILRPKVFLFENVYGLKGANNGEPWKEIVESFSELGYKLHADILDAADYGVPQHRERLIIVGCLEDKFVFPEPTHGPDSSSDRALVSVGEAIKDLQDNEEPEHEFDGLYGHLLSLIPEGLNYSFLTKEMGYPQPYFAWRSKFHDFLYKADRNKPCRTLKAQPGKFTGPFHWKNRHFSVEELKRIQSFPDDYILTGSYTKILEQIGNSVPPRLAEVLATSVKEQILSPISNLTYKKRPENFIATFKKRQRLVSDYYKKVAKEEIKAKFRNQSQEETKIETSKSEFIINYQSFFIKEIVQHENLLTEPGNSAFSVKSCDKGNKKQIDIKYLMKNCLPAYIVNVEICGLEKYLIKTDTVNVRAEILNFEDVFKVWDIIQERLTSTSQFFTLIDIYGHYANRGDTVKIKTDFNNDVQELVAKAITYFGNSDNCGCFLNRKAVTEALNIKEDQINLIVQLLRELRFDIRTSNTHPTIRTNEILCTYPFPLLSDKAQLERKIKA